MAAFKTIYGCEATVLRDISMIYIHCVSKEDFPLSLSGIECVELVCRQVHCSFLEKLAERRVCLMPRMSDGRSVDTIFEGIRSPALVRIMSSSDVKFFDRTDDRNDLLVATIIWSYVILPAPAALQVRPIPTSENKEVDEFLPPLTRSYRLDCNCFGGCSNVCLTAFDLRQQIECASPELDSLADLLLDQDELSDLSPSPSSTDASMSAQAPAAASTPTSTGTHSTPAPSSILAPTVDLHTEYFTIKGATWEDRYQLALSHCSKMRAMKEDIIVRVLPEPSNFIDKNSHKFEAFQNGEWNILGYCEVAKLPKLIKALRNNEIKSITITNIRRTWIPMVSSFSFSAGLHIVKCGVWAKNDSQNRYNSTINV